MISLHRYNLHSYMPAYTLGALKLLPAVDRQIRCLGQELAKQVIGALVGASLPRAVRITEIHRNPRIGAELLVMAHLFAPVTGWGSFAWALQQH